MTPCSARLGIEPLGMLLAFGIAVLWIVHRGWPRLWGAWVVHAAGE